jgi:hypothetical protein
MMRHDYNSSLWATPAPRGNWLMRRLAFGAVGAVVTLIAGLALVEQVTPLSAAAGCSPSWPYLDANCGREGGGDVTVIRPIRVVGIDHNAPVVIAKAPAPESIVSPAPVRPAAPAIASERPRATEPSTDGAGRAETIASPQPVESPQPAASAQPVASAPLPETELTFKAGSQRRPGVAAAAKDEAAHRPASTARKTVRSAKPARAVTQTVELPDGRRVTVHRGYRNDNRGGWRMQAEAGRRYDDSPSGASGERRSQWGLGGLY